MDKKKQKEFLSLYEPIHDRFERFCRARVYGDMDYKDLMNETLLKAYQKFDTLRSKEAFLSFLFSIAIRTLANNKRKLKEDVYNYDESSFQVVDVNTNTETSTEVYMLLRHWHNCLKCRESVSYCSNFQDLISKRLQKCKKPQSRT